MPRPDFDEDEYSELRPPPSRSSDEPLPKKTKWINRERVLMFACRGISHAHRHLMMDLRKMMPHTRPDNKMERRKSLEGIKELCEMKNCNKAVLFEGRQVRDLYVWVGEVPSGPSAKFLVENIYTTAELKLTGNCLQGSRPLLSFDTNFDKLPHYKLLKELFIQVFGTPKGHPKSQPYIDHVFTFSILDNRIWFRNYQIMAEDGALAEIGPRFVLNPIKIFDGSFGGETLWENPKYISPAKFRRMMKMSKSSSSKYVNRVANKLQHDLTKPSETYRLKENDDIFGGDAFEKANEILKNSQNNSAVENAEERKTKKRKLSKLSPPRQSKQLKHQKQHKLEEKVEVKQAMPLKQKIKKKKLKVN